MHEHNALAAGCSGRIPGWHRAGCMVGGAERERQRPMTLVAWVILAGLILYAIACLVAVVGTWHERKDKHK